MNLLVVKYLVGLLVVIGPYVSTWYYRSEYIETDAALTLKTTEFDALKTEHDNLVGKLELEVRRASALAGAVSECSAATAALAEATTTAVNARERADKAAVPKIQQRQTNIATIREIIKEPTNATQECDQIKQLLDNSTVGSLRLPTPNK